jgi:epoxide hydrolase-like predicted phosphatase
VSAGESTRRRDGVKYRAVIFDLGGVVLSSPFASIRRFERARGLDAGAVQRVVNAGGEAGAWAVFERGECGAVQFYAALDREAERLGTPFSAKDLLETIVESASVRPEMLGAIRKLRARDIKAAALTNNWRSRDTSYALLGSLQREFDVFVESCVVGLRKPDRRIYAHALRELEVCASEAIFLDDMGENLKPARAMGITTIKVEDPATALAELEALLA